MDKFIDYFNNVDPEERDPATGKKGIYGEYLINAQGEDVVAGVRTPEPITKLEEDLPECYKEFM